MTLSFIYLFIGVLLGNLGHYATRNKESRRSPVKFDLKFWLSDNFLKLIHSIVIAVALNLAFNIHPGHTSKIIGFEWLPMYSLALGLFPDAVLSFLKNKFSLLQTKRARDKEGTTYNRID